MRARLLVVDPVAAHLAVSILNDQQVRRALSPLAELAERTGCAVLLVSHTIKTIRPGGHPLEAIGGSGGGLRAAARVAYLFGVNPQDADERVLACAKSNIGREPKSLRFELDAADPDGNGRGAGVASLLARGECELTASELLACADAARRPADKCCRAEEWLIGQLRPGPKRSHELQADARRKGISERTLRRATNQLRIVKGRGPGATWALPAALRKRLDEHLQQELDQLLGSGGEGE